MGVQLHNYEGKNQLNQQNENVNALNRKPKKSHYLTVNDDSNLDVPASPLGAMTDVRQKK